MAELSARDELARRQEELLAALVADGARPTGFDPEALQVQSRMLVAKRWAVLRKNCPDLVADLGDRFRSLCEEYCGERPLRSGEDHRVDAREFSRWLVRQKHISRRRPRSVLSWLRIWQR